MRSSVPLYLVLAGAILWRCARAEDASTAGTAESQAIDTTDVYNDFMSLSAADKSAVLSHFGALTFSQYASLGLSQAAATPVFVDGATQGNSRTQWLAVKDKASALDQRYPSIGAFWQANHIDPSRLALADVKSVVAHSAHSGEAATLSLDFVATPSLLNEDCKADVTQVSLVAMRDAMWIMGQTANEQLATDTRKAAIQVPKTRIATWAKKYGNGMLPEDINNYFSPYCWLATRTDRAPTRTSYLMGGVAFDPTTGRYIPPSINPTTSGSNPAYDGGQTSTVSATCAAFINAAVKVMSAAAASVAGPGECPTGP